MVASRKAVSHLRIVSDRSSAATNDAALAEAIVRAEPWGLEGAWKRYSGLALGMLQRGLGPSAVDFDALSQEIFLSLAIHLRRSPDQSLRKGVIALTARSMLRVLRRRQLRRRLGLLRRSSAVDFMDVPLDRHSRLALSRLYELLDELGPRGHALVSLAEFEGLGEADIAEALGWSLGRVAGQLTRARERFERRRDEDPLLSDYVAIQSQNRSEISEGA